MKFYSTNGKSPVVGLREAVLAGLAPDRGLYMPAEIPKLSHDFFNDAKGKSFPDMAMMAGEDFFVDDVPLGELESMMHEAFNFQVPLVELKKDLYVLELFHGPTLAFKDFAARFMARLFGYFVRGAQRQVTVLVATSGDTGSAVAHGFFNVEGIRVVILYPSGKVSTLQEKQLTSMGGNITALEVNGTFDDCQQMVKEALMDQELKERLTLASANSINIARLLPQIFYYLYTCVQLMRFNKPIIISVPSGNVGNLTAGLMAKKMGAPIERFVAATNRNDTIPKYLATGVFTPIPSVSTLSNAMDVGNPSNFARMRVLYHDRVEEMRRDLHSWSYSDEQTKQAIAEVHERYGYIMDPHGAVGYLGICQEQKSVPESVGVFLETAHPAKFSDIVDSVIGSSVPMSDRLKAYERREKKVTLIKNTFTELKEFLLSN